MAVPVGQAVMAQPAYPQAWPPAGMQPPPGWGPPPGYVYPPQQYAQPQPGQMAQYGQPGQPAPGQMQPGQMQPGQMQPGQPQPGYAQPGGQPYPQPGQQYAQPPQQYAQQPQQYLQPGQPGYPYNMQPGSMPPGYGYAQPGQMQPGQMQPGQQAVYGSAVAYQPPGVPPVAAPAQPVVAQAAAVAAASTAQSQPATVQSPPVPAAPVQAKPVEPAPVSASQATASATSTPAAKSPGQPKQVVAQAPVTAAPAVQQTTAPIPKVVETTPVQPKAPTTTASPTVPAVVAASKPATTSSATSPKKTAPATSKTASSAKAAAIVGLAGIETPSFKDRLHHVSPGEWIQMRLREAPGYVVSILLHVLVLFMLSMAILPDKDRQELFNTIIAKTEAPEQINDKLDDSEIIPEKLENLQTNAANAEINSEVVTDKPSPVELDVSDAAPTIDAPESVEGAGPKMPQGDLAGRTKKGRANLAQSQGGTAASELAVESGLKWLSKHQKPDGSWSFKHGPDEPGNLDNPTGATGMALLAFLGAGHTHKTGDYKREVGGGLQYLVAQMQPTGAGGDLRGPGGSMYTQGICGIALCEAYALSKDKDLRQPTQLAINFIINAQDPKGGGWRYQPGQPGDTSAVGWQIMALKSAKIAKLTVPPKTIGKATAFLNFVQANGGANYGYDGPGAGPATSAVGLLCRMYLGWTPKQQGLLKGVEYLGKMGPQPGNMYFNYYGTQVMHHWGGEPWAKWNNVMRDYLVKSQEKTGIASGSWKPVGGGDHGDAAGGRHYRTCMSIMTLEVYYRHLPLYQRETIKVQF
ncbi:MAG: hypothetical protein JWM11_1689 [Planctomycetaceae bacterium]|nr:hypothetical protein [Planctomycetaceae bacterium]